MDRTATEIRRAALAVFDDERVPPSGEESDEALAAWRTKILQSRLVTAMAALNLMGVHTLLPGESPFTVAVDMPAGICVYLQNSADPDGLGLVERLDALSGLILDFRRSTIFLNGLHVQAISLLGLELSALVAAHPELMSAFGDFLVHKYITEGWNLS